MAHKASTYQYFLITLALSVFLPSCIFEYDNCPPEDAGFPLSIRYYWNVQSQILPEGMANIFYPIGESGYWRYDCPPDGGSFNLPFGCYDAVCYNNATEAILFRGMDDFNTLEIYTRNGAITDVFRNSTGWAKPPRGREKEQDIRMQPDMIWTSTSPVSIAGSTADSVVFSPQRVTPAYNLLVTDIINLASAVRYCFSISDLSAGYFPGMQSHSDIAVTVPASLTAIDSSRLFGRLLCFGLVSDTCKPVLTLYIWLGNGEKRVYNYDIGEQIRSAPDPSEVLIRIIGPELPYMEPGASGGGLDVDVDNWEVVDIELSTR